LFSGRYYAYYEGSVSKAMDTLTKEIEDMQHELEPMSESSTTKAALTKSILLCRGKHSILLSKKSKFTRLLHETSIVLHAHVEPYFRWDCPSSAAMPSSSQNNTYDVDAQHNHPVGTAENHTPHHQEVGVDLGNDDSASDSAEEGDSVHGESYTNNE
jgi:hypothetical protein